MAYCVFSYFHNGPLFLHFSFIRSPSFIEGRCPGTMAPVFGQLYTFATAPIIYLKGRSFTISCWVKETNTANSRFLIYGDFHNSEHFWLARMEQRIMFDRRTIPSATPFYLASFNDVSLSSWTHLVVTWHHVTGALSMYADGKTIGHTTYPPNEEVILEPSGEPYKIGSFSSGSAMDLYVFGTALSPNEINRLRGSLLSFISIGQKLYFKVTVYLLRCLASKRCSTSGLNCRYLDPFIKLKLIELAIKPYQEF